MSKAGEELILSMENALAHARGEKRAVRETTFRVFVPEKIDVAALRGKLGLTQEMFALRFGISVKSVRNWEQGTRQPERPARAYLAVIARNPRAVEEALGVA